jgi:hypothetical protein
LIERTKRSACAFVGQRLAEAPTPLRIAVADQDTMGPENPVGVCQRARALVDEGVVGMRSRPDEMHTPRRQLDDKQRVVRD